MSAFIFHSLSPVHRRSILSSPTRSLPLRRLAKCSLEQPLQNVATRVLAGVAIASLALHPGLFTEDFAAWAARGGGASFSAASGSVNKDGESLLRWALPIDNAQIRELQGELENITGDLRGLKWGSVADDVRRARGVAERKSEGILMGLKKDLREEGAKLLDEIKNGIGEIGVVVGQKNGDLVVEKQKGVLRKVGNLEEMMVEDFPFQVPQEYDMLPWLKGRATVEMVVRKAGEEKFDVDGRLYDDGKLTMVVDGYTAPVTAGNFVQLVDRGFYDGKEIIRSDGFVVQTGKPEGNIEGYIDPETKELRTVPLEVFAKGDREPTYGITLEDDGRGAAATVLPFSSYGTLAFAREEFSPNSGSSQFFWFLFEPDLTPAGRNLLDGRYAVFGYTVQGQKFLKGLQQGDQIVQAKVTAGLENLVTPKL